MGDAAFDAGYQHGRTLTQADAVALVLAQERTRPGAGYRHCGQADQRVAPQLLAVVTAPEPSSRRSPMSLEDRVVIVTGGAGGMGKGIAGVLVERGAKVAVVDLERDAAVAAATELDPSGRRAVGFAVDVTDEVAVEAMVQAVVSAFDRVDGLVNNAGVIVMAPAWEADALQWRNHFEVNVVGSFVCAKAVGEQLRRQKTGGSIVNISSNCGKAGYPNMAAYNASKAAVIGLTRSLAMEWHADGINVNAVCPGGVDTPMLDQVATWLSPRLNLSAADVLTGMGSAQLGGRLINPVEVGRVVAFLLSDDAIIVRGQAISVDAGATPY